MRSFGGSTNGVCYGCAATNTICQIVGRSFDAHEIEWFKPKRCYKMRLWFLGEFEHAIDALRSGDIQAYNSIAEEIGIAQIHETGKVGFMTTENYRELIPQYRELARTQPKQEKWDTKQALSTNTKTSGPCCEMQCRPSLCVMGIPKIAIGYELEKIGGAGIYQTIKIRQE